MPQKRVIHATGPVELDTTDWREGTPFASFDGLRLFWPGYDPTCSHKDFAISKLLQSSQGRALLLKRALLVISSSGNAGFALAKATARYARRGVRVLVVMDKLSGVELEKRLKETFSHVEVVVIDEPDASGSHATARQRYVDKVMGENDNAIQISQYGRDGTITHCWGEGYDQMIADIERGFPDMEMLMMPTGTAASLFSAAKYQELHNRKWKLVGVDAAGSVLTGIPKGKRLFSGYGNGARTIWLDQSMPSIAAFAKVDDAATVAASQQLLKAGLFMGGSGAACVAAALWFRDHDLTPHRGTTVCLAPDHGSLYASTLYSPSFLRAHGFGK